MAADPRSKGRLTHVHWCLLLLTASVVANVFPFVSYRPGDAHQYLIPWYEHIVAAGRIGAFARPFSNYTPPYLYLLSAGSLLDGWIQPLMVIKFLSVIGAAWMVYSIHRLLVALRAEWPLETALASMLLPSIVLNVSVFGQADTFWVAPCVLAVVGAVERRLGAVAFWSGVALAFKAQAVFLAPFVWLLFLTRKAPSWCWIAPIAVYTGAMLPAWLVGWPATDLLTVYFRQAEWQPEFGRTFISNSASWWTIYGAVFPKLALQTFWFGYLTAALAVLMYVAVLSKRALTPKMMIAAAALSAGGTPFLLPGMHERFFILADVLTFCLAFSERTRRTIAAAVLMQIASSLTGYGWAFKVFLLKLPACFFSLGALILLIEYLAQAEAEANQFGTRRAPRDNASDLREQNLQASEGR